MMNTEQRKCAGCKKRIQRGLLYQGVQLCASCFKANVNYKEHPRHSSEKMDHYSDGKIFIDGKGFTHRDVEAIKAFAKSLHEIKKKSNCKHLKLTIDHVEFDGYGTEICTVWICKDCGEEIQKYEKSLNIDTID